MVVYIDETWLLIIHCTSLLCTGGVSDALFISLLISKLFFTRAFREPSRVCYYSAGGGQGKKKKREGNEVGGIKEWEWKGVHC
jgi:hypothetical protein